MELFCSFILLFLINHYLAAAQYYHCYTTGNFTLRSGYDINRRSLLSKIAPSVKDQGGYSMIHTGNYTYLPASQRASVYCLGLCRKDLIATDECSICLSNSSSIIATNCPVEKEVVAWGKEGECIVRCSPNDFSQAYDLDPSVHACNLTNISVVSRPQFRHALVNLTHSIARRAADEGSFNSFSTDSQIPQYFATEEAKLDRFKTIYALGLCLPTLSESSCTSCLEGAASESEQYCDGTQGAMILTPTCIFRYESYPFYKSPSVAPFPSPLQPIPPASPPSYIVKREKRNKKTVATAIVTPVVLVLTVIALGLTFIINNKFKKRNKYWKHEEGAAAAEDKESCFEFSIGTIRLTTNNFSPSNKLGQGGFGAVYKGILPNGQHIAVKRLAVLCAHGDLDFRNEVQLVARLHHKNLIRLFGFCLREKERILIYELAFNGSLDSILFDPSRREHLSWEMRYRIILGIVRGMLYLHEESQLRIIHRDLKASNVLLDESMNPKISDFGTARLFVDDQGKASRIVGTFGYMAPEYAKQGKISAKIDVFSFGVLLLEIVSGKRNSTFNNPKHIEHLLSKAWKCWTRRKLQDMIDPVLQRASSQTNEIVQCVHIGLLCVQENAEYRPTMSTVNLMLDSRSQSFPSPLKPAYLMDFYDDDTKMLTMEDHIELRLDDSVTDRSEPATRLLSVSSKGLSSVNEVTITEEYPEPR